MKILILFCLMKVIIIEVHCQTNDTCAYLGCSCKRTIQGNDVTCVGNATATPTLTGDYYPQRNPSIRFALINNFIIVGYNFSLLPSSIFYNVISINVLYLGSNGLNTIGNSSFNESTFGGFKSLYVVDESLKTIESGAFGTLRKNVTELHLINCSISDSILETFVDAFGYIGPNLNELSLSFNSLTKVTPKVMSLFTQLNTIDLSSNRLTTIGPDVFAQNPLLIELDFSGNRVDNLTAFLTNLGPSLRSQLVTLKLSDVGLVDLGVIPELSSLRTFVLSRNSVKSIRVANAFRNLKALRELYLAYNGLESIEDDSFANLDVLQTLDLSNNLLSRVPTFRNFTFLRLVSMKNQNGRLTLINDYAFDNMVGFVYINLDENNVTFGNRAFCLRVPVEMNLVKLTLSYASARNFNKCYMKQFNLVGIGAAQNQLEITAPANLSELINQASNVCTCEFEGFAAYLRFTLVGVCDQVPLTDCSNVQISDDCPRSYDCLDYPLTIAPTTTLVTPLTNPTGTKSPINNASTARFNSLVYSVIGGVVFYVLFF